MSAIFGSDMGEGVRTTRLFRSCREGVVTICETGIHVGQLKLMIAQADETVALAQKWLEQIHHLADHGDLADSSASVAQATVLLGEARARLQAAIVASDSGPDDQVSVERV